MTRVNLYFCLVSLLIAGFFQAGCRSSDPTEYFERYESAESAYMGPDIRIAEEELVDFASYLNGLVDRKSGSGSVSYWRALVLTKIRLYEIYSYQDETREAERCLDSVNEIAAKSEPGTSEAFGKDEIDALVESIQRESKTVPLWKKVADPL